MVRSSPSWNKTQAIFRAVGLDDCIELSHQALRSAALPSYAATVTAAYV